MLHLLPNTYKQLYIFHVILLVTFIIAGCFVFPIVIIAYILLYNIHQLLYKAIINRLCYFLWIHFTFIAQWWSGLRIKLYGKQEDVDWIGKENVLAIMNHKYDIDWIVPWLIAEKGGGLGGSQSFAKKSLKFMPLIGWIWNFNGTIFLNRDWTKDKAVIAESLKDFNNTLPGYKNLLLLYPEGTRFTPEKQESSNEIARSKGMPELKHCLIPRSRGFVEILKNLRHQIDAFYDFTVGFPDSVNPSVKDVNTSQPGLTMQNILNARVKEGSVCYERILMKDLPEGDEDLALWLQERFRIKDAMFEKYVTTGKFDGPCRTIIPNHIGLIVYHITFILVWALVGTWLCRVLWLYSWLVRATIIGVIITICIFIQFMMNITQASKGSSYGKKEKSK